MWFTRKRAKIMEADHEMKREEKREKLVFRKASDETQVVTTEIDKNIERMNQTIRNQENIDALVDDVIRVFHDDKEQNLRLTFAPIRLDLRSVQAGISKSFLQSGSYFDFEKMIKQRMEQDYPFEVWLFHQCEPEIRHKPQSRVINLSSLFEALSNVHKSTKKLVTYADQINTFNNKVIDEIQESVWAIVKCIYEGTMKDHQFTLTKEAASPEIKNVLEDLMDFRSVCKNIGSLSMRNQRLAQIKRELFEASR
jgi:hypothetical protein